MVRKLWDGLFIITTLVKFTFQVKLIFLYWLIAIIVSTFKIYPSTILSSRIKGCFYTGTTFSVTICVGTKNSGVTWNYVSSFNLSTNNKYFLWSSIESSIGFPVPCEFLLVNKWFCFNDFSWYNEGPSLFYFGVIYKNETQWKHNL